MVTEQGKGKKMQEELASRQGYKRALETLERFAEMMGGKLTQPSGIIKRSSRGQWQSHPALQLRESPYSSVGRGKAK